MLSCIFVLRFRGFKRKVQSAISWRRGGAGASFQGNSFCLMALTADEREMIRRCFRIVSGDRRQAPARFHDALFERAPETRDLFVNEQERQGAELIEMLAEQVGNDLAPETRAAWVKAHGEVSGPMVRSACSHEGSQG